MSLTCDWCGKTFDRSGERGPIPKYCSANHRQRAYEARRAVKVFEAALPKIDLSAFAAVQELSAEALGLTKAMEAATAPMRDALSSVAFDQLERVRRETAESIKVFEAALPKIDLSVVADIDQFPVEGLTSILEGDDLTLARGLLGSLQSRPLLEWSMDEVLQARESWDQIAAEIESLDIEVDPALVPGNLEGAAILATLGVLVAVEAGSSKILLDVAIFTLNALLGLIHMTWQAASLPGVSAPVGTLGGLSGIVALALYLRDRGSQS